LALSARKDGFELSAANPIGVSLPVAESKRETWIPLLALLVVKLPV